jgi:hypothetical protein
MSRKKVITKAKAKKATATAAKRPATKKAANTLSATLEKNFKDTHAKLIAQCRKDLSGQQQQEKKLQSELKKAQAQKKTSQKQAATLAAKHKSKPSAATKKQLAAHKQTVEKHTKTITGLTANLNVSKATTKSIAQQQNKHTAIQKLLSAFEKQWEMKARQAATAKAKPRKTAKKKPAASTPASTTTSTHHEPTMINENDLETVE